MWLKSVEKVYVVILTVRTCLFYLIICCFIFFNIPYRSLTVIKYTESGGTKLVWNVKRFFFKLTKNVRTMTRLRYKISLRRFSILISFGKSWDFKKLQITPLFVLFLCPRFHDWTFTRGIRCSTIKNRTKSDSYFEWQLDNFHYHYYRAGKR